MHQLRHIPHPRGSWVPRFPLNPPVDVHAGSTMWVWPPGRCTWYMHWRYSFDQGLAVDTRYAVQFHHTGREQPRGEEADGRRQDLGSVVHLQHMRHIDFSPQKLFQLWKL